MSETTNELGSIVSSSKDGDGEGETSSRQKMSLLKMSDVVVTVFKIHSFQSPASIYDLVPSIFTMERVESDATPAEEWLQSLNATCNRLSTQYLNLLRAASSASALEEGRHDPRGM